MNLVQLNKEDFPLWKKFRMELYKPLDENLNDEEMERIYSNELWICRLIENENGERIGLVELSLRNIVDGCLSSPVPYLEGLYLIESERGKGRGKEIVNLITKWCKDRGYIELSTDTEISNFKAQNFYEALGFEEVDRVVEYRLDVK